MWILFVFALLAAKTKACGEYGDGMEAAECTQGFPTMFHIDQVLGNTELDTVASRQVLVPSINFTCNGTITKWIFGANWRGFSPALTEFQIWRSVSSTTYRKMSGTEVRVGGRNSSDMYEYQLQTSMEFQEGDILGYFQPIANRSQLDLYLEDSNRITTYHQSLCVDCLSPSPTGDTFSLTSAPSDTRYPVIAVTTAPADCGCGFMSEERVHALLTSTYDGDLDDFREKAQFLFPSLNFTCSGRIMKWIVVGRYRKFNGEFPELHLWRKLGNLSGLYKKINNTGTVLSVISEKDDDVYEFIPSTTLIAQPGDIVGLYTPNRPIFRPEYDENRNILYYWNSARQDRDSEDSEEDVFEIFDSRTSFGSPLITVEISPFRVKSSSKTLLQTHETRGGGFYSSVSLSSASSLPSGTPTSPQTKQSTNRDSRTPLVVGSAVGGLVAITTVVFIFTLCVCLRKRCLTRKQHTLPRNTDSSIKIDSNYVQKDHMYAYATHPTVCSVTEYNVAYDAQSFGNDATDLATRTSWNDAYAVNSNKGTDECVYEENYDNVVPVREGLDAAIM